ncbi:hypothetical protein HMPREF1171_01571 [Aeromonas dhakensis]|uniref:Uncharacterized protein n=1 Tax=Aeromonas dhakensis TaxID=196024 RepID=K1JKA0_9GAMM|nr:hypothetical protein HMPREF1171_01571 [Aeromonas dhakensis]
MRVTMLIGQEWYRSMSLEILTALIQPVSNSILLLH